MTPELEAKWKGKVERSRECLGYEPITYEMISALDHQITTLTRERDEAIGGAIFEVEKRLIERAESAERERDCWHRRYDELGEQAKIDIRDSTLAMVQAERERDEARGEIERLKEFHSFRILAIRQQIREWADNRPSSADIQVMLDDEGYW